MAQVNSKIITDKNGLDIVIRTAVNTDAERLRIYTRKVLIDSDWSVTQAHEYNLTEDQGANWIKGHHEHPCHLLLIAAYEEKIIGLLDFQNYQRERNQHVGRFGMSVHAKWRQRGVGMALLTTLLEWARGNPLIEKVTLAVFSTNVPALQLYKKVGFKEEGRRLREYQLSKGTYIDDILMYNFINEV